MLSIAAKVCPPIPGMNHSGGVKTTTGDSSSLPGLSLTVGSPSWFSQCHKHTLTTEIHLVLFSEGAEPCHL